MINLNDQKTVVEKKVEEGQTSQDSSPQSQTATTKPQTTQDEVAPQETPVEVSDETSDAETGGEPNGMSDEARRAFQEQRLEIKRLKEEMEARKKGESAFDAFRPKTQPSTPDINSFVNSDTGEVNWTGYNQAVMSQAQAVASQTVQEQLDEAKAREKFPDVFADNDLEEAIAGQWLANKLQGKSTSVYELAEKFSKKLTSATTRAEKEGAKKALTELTPKEQASLSVQGQSSSSANTQASVEDEEILRVRARRGDENAVAQLMKGVAWKK